MTNVSLHQIHTVINPHQAALVPYHVYLQSHYTDKEEEYTFKTKDAAIKFAEENADEDTVASVWLEDECILCIGGTYD